jgi:peptide/nickel transport system permease protein
VAGYLLKRLGGAVVVLFLTALLLAAAVHLVPGDPARAVLGAHATPELIAQIRAKMGLDKPVAVQLWDFFSGLLRGDLGTDFVGGVKVTTLIGEALPDTLALALASMILAVAGGIPLGIAVARRPGGVSRPADAWPVDGLRQRAGLCDLAHPPADLRGETALSAGDGGRGRFPTRSITSRA